MNREHALQRLSTEEFDVLVIGGGATGTGCALDAQLRGLKVALIEQEDFAAGASSRSTKLIHGGVRYLERAAKEMDLGQVQFVREALLERATMIANAPFLAQQLPLIIPVYSSFDKWYYALGLHVYDWLAGTHNLAQSKRLSREETLAAVPTLKQENLKGGILYWDGQFNDARYAIALAHTAHHNGAVVTNHVQLLGFEKTGNALSVARVRDSLTGNEWQVRARFFLNATGAYADSVRQLANPNAMPRLKPTKGIHIVLPRSIVSGCTAVLIPKTDDGRVVFAIPWQDVVLVGTTDTASDMVANAPPVAQSEVAYLLDHINRYLACKATPQDVLASFAGLRPLLNAQGTPDTKSLSRGHEVEIDSSGLVSVLGGKWTTYRVMAQEAVDVLAEELGVEPVVCTTASHKLYGADGREWQALHARTGWAEDVCRHLSCSYGSAATTVVAIAEHNSALALLVVEGYPYMKAEVVYAVREEMACTIEDVLSRRFRLEVVNEAAARQAAPIVADILAGELQWTEDDKDAQLQHYLDALNKKNAV